jgi:TrmH family RNA methyltransferase
VPIDASRLRKIESRQNSLLKELRKAFHGGEVTDDGYCAIESVKTIEEAIRSGLRLRAVVFSESARNRVDRLLPQIAAHAETAIVPDDVFSGVVATDTPQGVAALVKIPQPDLEKVMQKPDPLLVVAAGLQDPGNVGTVIRSAEAFGAAAVLMTEGSASQFNPKVVRASAGSIFRLPVVKTAARELVAALRSREIRLLATSSHKGTAIDKADLKGGVALFIGSEGAGLPKALAQQMDETLAIPHSAGVESLNAGVAASIVLYEAARQRRSEES